MEGASLGDIGGYEILERCALVGLDGEIAWVEVGNGVGGLGLDHYSHSTLSAKIRRNRKADSHSMALMESHNR